jgi:hypothetical protein
VLNWLPSIRLGWRRFLTLAGSEGPVRAIRRTCEHIQKRVTGRLRGSDVQWLGVRATRMPTTRPSAIRHAPQDLQPLTALARSGSELSPGVCVCFVVTVCTDDQTALDRTLQSILRQTDTSWEVLMSASAAGSELLSDWLDRDWRIRRLPEPTSDDHELRRAAQYATARFVGCVDQGDLVDDGLVELVVKSQLEHPNADVVYTDEATILPDSRIERHFYKPDWSPEHLQSANYLGRFVALRKSLVLRLNISPSPSPEASDYALLLAATSQARDVVHIDEALYLTAATKQRAIGGFFASPTLGEAKRGLQRQVRLECPSAEVVEGRAPGSLQVNWPIALGTPITLVILTGMRERFIAGRGQIQLATHFVRSIIERSSYPNYQVLMVDDGLISSELEALLQQSGHQRQSYRTAGAFSFADKANFGVRLVEKGVILLLNDDMEVIEPDWIQAMAGLALRPAIGVVGARLLYADDTIQHAGICLGYHGATGHILHRERASGGEYGGFASITRNFSAVTGAAMAFRRTVFDELGGFDSQFSVDYNDVDFCLRARRLGYRVAVSAAASLYHFQNSSLRRAHDNPVERRAFLERWRGEISRDPYFSKHFQRRFHDEPLLDDAVR